jgi:hypothetical protein
MPYTGIVLALLGVHLAVFLILLGHWIASAGFFPNAVQRIATVYETRPIRAALLGLFTYGPLFLIFLNSGKLGGAALLGVAMGFAILVVAFIGTSGLALLIGRNLAKDVSVWHQSLRGGVMLALVFITPFLGSAFLMHIGLASGFGAVLIAKPWKAAKPVADSIAADSISLS